MIRLFKNLTKKDVLYIFICLTLIVFQVWLDLKLPDYMSEITRVIETTNSSVKDIIIPGVFMMLCALGSLASSIIVGYFAAIISSSFSKNIRKLIFQKVNSFSMEEIKKFEISSLITRTTNDVTQMEMVIAMGLQMIIKAPIMAVWAVSKIIKKNYTWSILTGGCVLILLITIISILLIVIPRFEKVQKLIDKINGTTTESLTGIRVIRAFNAENFQSNRFDKVNTDLTNQQLFNQRCFALLSPIMNVVMHGLTLGIYMLGATMIYKASLLDKITLFSDMVVFTSYGIQVIMSFLMLAMIFMMVPRAQISARRINEVINEKIKIKDGQITDVDALGTVEFKNVSFKYPDATDYIIKDITFTANKGETVAFIGSTGSGKSTLINLVPRFYDVTEGSILVDGVDVKDYKLSSLHDKIGYVSQKAVIFTGSVYDNITYGGKTDISDEDIASSLEVSQAYEFVSKLDEGVKAKLSRGGTNISGGQKQRISIARAIAHKPEIYIFDDSFSALDYKTDAKLRKALKEYTKDATLLIVAQRIGTVLNADKIIVLDNGECVGIGNHATLLKTCDVYKEIALSQLSKEELENA